MFSAQDKKAVIHPLRAPYDHVNKLQEHKELQKIWQPIISAHHHHKIPNIRAMQKHFLGYFTITAQIMPHQYPTALTTVFLHANNCCDSRNWGDISAGQLALHRHAHLAQQGRALALSLL